MKRSIIASIPKNLENGILESYRIEERVFLAESDGMNKQTYQREYHIQSTLSASQEWVTRAVTPNLFKALFTLTYTIKKGNECYDVRKLMKSIDDEAYKS